MNKESMNAGGGAPVGCRAWLGVINRQLSDAGRRGYKVIRDRVLSTSQSASTGQLQTDSSLGTGKSWWSRLLSKRKPRSGITALRRTEDSCDTSPLVTSGAIALSQANGQSPPQCVQRGEPPERERKRRDPDVAARVNFYLEMWSPLYRAFLASGASSAQSRVKLNYQLAQPYVRTPNDQAQQQVPAENSTRKETER